ncbi:MAG: DUF305 domain-containing protein [Sporichthyaceae bacterium]
MRRTIGFAVVTLVVGTLLGFGAGIVVSGEDVPADSSAAAGFSRDMQTHHRQAVRMALIVRDSTDDPEIRTLAYDIALTQQQQTGQMYAWLAQWGLSQTGTPMAWMSSAQRTAVNDQTDVPPMAGHSQSMPGMDAQAMPGMASTADLTDLERLSGQAAERRFLQLMIDHHRGGVAMAQALLDAGAPDQVEGLAGTIVAAQNAEITAMQDLLRTRDGAP